MYWNKDDVRKNSSKVKKVFFYRVCGTGMGAAACLLQEKGYLVEGADIKFYPPMSDYLKRMNIRCHEMNKVDTAFLSQYDLIVVGNVVPKKSEAATLIESAGVAYCSFPAALGGLVLHDINVIGISGTHGKTTTTHLCAQVFEKLGERPGYFIGGVLEERPSSLLGEGKYFFIESDEYDCSYFEKFSKFRQYEINQLVITSLEFDHADIYDDLNQIQDQFRKYIPYLEKPLIANLSYQALVELKDDFSDKIWSDYRPIVEREDSKGSSFSLAIGQNNIQFKTNLIGFHNIQNISVAILLAAQEGFSIEAIKEAILDLKMVKRRQELRGYYHESPIIDDFAHHPRSVALTIEATQKRFANKEIAVFFEPHSATARSDLFRKEFSLSLSKADLVFLLSPSTSTSVRGAEDYDIELSAKEIGAKEVLIVKDLSHLRTLLDQYASAARVFLFLSNGTCMGLWNSDFVQQLERDIISEGLS